MNWSLNNLKEKTESAIDVVAMREAQIKFYKKYQPFIENFLKQVEQKETLSIE